MVMRHTSIIIRLLDMKPLVGGFNPSEKYESQWETIITPLLAGWWFQPLWKIWKSVGKIIPIYIYIWNGK